MKDAMVRQLDIRSPRISSEVEIQLSSDITTALRGILIFLDKNKRMVLPDFPGRVIRHNRRAMKRNNEVSEKRKP